MKMRADRLIAILIMLKQRGKMTAGELAEALEVSERTIHRDMEALCSAGLPVVAERGKTGGWRLVDHWPHQLSWLKINEMKSLFIPHSDHLLADLGLEVASIKARAKLLASVPGTFRQDAKILGERIYIDLRTWRDSAEKIRSFQVIQKAVWECRKLRMTYKTSDGQTNPRTIEPLGLVFKSSHWYLVAKRDEEFRTYRASRIQSAALLEETFARPEDFNLKEYWMKSKARFIKKIPQYKIRSRLFLRTYFVKK
jgi:predicted DNA-binding transcriptional regulator YafY